MRYAQPFDISTPGRFPGALVAAEAHDPAPPPPRERRITFRDCDIVPRVLFASMGDRVVFHADTSQAHLPHIEGSGAVIDQALIPGQEDQLRSVARPGRYIVNSRTMPSFVHGLLFMLPNHFIDTTDVQGHFRIDDVPVGTTTVHAWYPGAAEARIVVAIQAGAVVHTDFHLHQLPERPPLPQQTGADVLIIP